MKHFKNEIERLQRKCNDYEGKEKRLNDKATFSASEKTALLGKIQKYEMRVTDLKDKLSIVGTEKHSLLDKNQRYEKQATELKEDILLLKKSAWIGIDNYAKLKIESLEKQVEE